MIFYIDDGIDIDDTRIEPSLDAMSEEQNICNTNIWMIHLSCLDNDWVHIPKRAEKYAILMWEG